MYYKYYLFIQGIVEKEDKYVLNIRKLVSAYNLFLYS